MARQGLSWWKGPLSSLPNTLSSLTWMDRGIHHGFGQHCKMDRLFFRAFTHCIIHSLPILPLLNRCPKPTIMPYPFFSLKANVLASAKQRISHWQSVFSISIFSFPWEYSFYFSLLIMLSIDYFFTSTR